MRLRRPDVSTARSVTTYRPGVRNRDAGTQFLANVPHDVLRMTAHFRPDDRARALLSRSMIVVFPSLSSQTRNRAYTRTPTRRSDRKVSVGALFPDTVVVVVDVLPPGTAADVFDVAYDTPEAVPAVTSTRRRWPASPARTPYVWPVAPTMLRQSVLSESQRCHCRVVEVGVGDHVPVVDCSSSPTVADPLSAGRTVLFGPLASEIGSVGCDAAVARPSALTAVTSTVSACPTSPCTGLYVFSVAPAMSPHAVPSIVHRCHLYSNDVGLLLQVPFPAVSVWPSRSVPVTVGGAVLTGVAFDRASTAAGVSATRAPAATTATPNHGRRHLLRLIFSSLCRPFDPLTSVRWGRPTRLASNGGCDSRRVSPRPPKSNRPPRKASVGSVRSALRARPR